MEIIFICKEWPLKMHKKILFMFIFEYTNKMKYFLSYIKKCQMGTYFLGWVYKDASMNTVQRAISAMFTLFWLSSPWEQTYRADSIESQSK